MRANIMGGEPGDMLFEDLEGLLREINDFCSSCTNKPEEIPQPLESYLCYVAKTGNTVFPWQHVRLLFRNKIMQAMEQFPGETHPNNESFVMERFDLFRSAPFTIQRLAELITQPTHHYKKKGKFLNGLEKTVLVVSTVEPWSVDSDYRNGNESNASDGEMDQTYSESDDSGNSNNRSYGLGQRESLGISDGGQGDGLELNARMSSASGIGMDNVTTTMVNITSNGSQSTAALRSSSSEHMDAIATSELGLSAVVTSDQDGVVANNGDGHTLPQDAYMQLDENRLSEIVSTAGTTATHETYLATTAGGSSAGIEGLEMTSVEVGQNPILSTAESAAAEEHRGPSATSAESSSTLQMEHVEVQGSIVCADASEEVDTLDAEDAQIRAMDLEVSIGEPEIVTAAEKSSPTKQEESAISAELQSEAGVGVDQNMIEGSEFEPDRATEIAVESIASSVATEESILTVVTPVEDKIHGEDPISSAIDSGVPVQDQDILETPSEPNTETLEPVGNIDNVAEEAETTPSPVPEAPSDAPTVTE